jgi:hypothetical protein
MRSCAILYPASEIAAHCGLLQRFASFQSPWEIAMSATYPAERAKRIAVKWRFYASIKMNSLLVASSVFQPPDVCGMGQSKLNNWR